MADGGKVGRPWDSAELDAIVVDYFTMLSAELSNRPYVKSHRSVALAERIGRSRSSVEYKHQNISAVLDELGLPWIRGYLPMRKYQGALFDAIDRFITADPAVLNPAVRPSSFRWPQEDVFVRAPPMRTVASPDGLLRLIRKFDPVERDRRNRALGRAGEQFVMEIERRTLEDARRPDLAGKVRWVSDETGDGAGYDVLSFDPAGRELLIEVKSTNGGPYTPFFLTGNEYAVSREQAAAWRLYRVHRFAQGPRIFTLAPPLDASVNLQAATWRASFGS